MSARYPRWVVGSPAEIDRIARDRGRMLLYDAKGHPLVLFEDAWGLRWALEHETGVTFHEVAP
jgi:peptide chain release factor 3